MLKCAICDDDRSSAELISGIINEYPEKLSKGLYFNPSALLADLKSEKRYDLYILDIVMPELSGVELAREIRKIDGNCVIIFLTSSDEFYKDAFDVEALQYLIKPINRDMLFRAFDRALRYIGQRSNDALPIETKSGIHVIQTKQIVYAEAFRHIITFHFPDGSSIETLNSSLSLEKLAELLCSPNFCTPHRSYIVNFAFVNYLRKLQLSMITGAVIPIPQKQFSKIRKQYSDYLLSRYTKGEL